MTLREIFGLVFLIVGGARLFTNKVATAKPGVQKLLPDIPVQSAEMTEI